MSTIDDDINVWSWRFEKVIEELNRDDLTVYRKTKYTDKGRNISVNYKERLLKKIIDIASWQMPQEKGER